MNRLITSDKPGALPGILSKLALAMAASVVVANGAAAQTPAYPPATYADLLFDPAEIKHVFRLDGMPWICRGDTFCKPVKIDGVADKDLKLATIEPLGYAGKRYFLSYSQANLQKGRPIALACEDTRCEKLDAAVGPTSSLGVYQVKDGDRVQTRTALLRHLDERKGRAQLLWCSERDCSEMPLTRDGERFSCSTWAPAIARDRTSPGCATARARRCPAPRPRLGSATS